MKVRHVAFVQLLALGAWQVWMRWVPATVQPESKPARDAGPVGSGANRLPDAAAAEAPPPEPAAPTASVVPPTHATPEQRRADADRLARDTDLKALREALEARAEAGDADAAWALARLYQSCAQSWQMTARAGEYAQMRGFLRAAGQSEAELAALDAQMARWQQRCAGFGEGPALALFAERWRARGLALGSPEARLSAELPRGQRDSAQAERLMQDGRRAGIELLQRGEAMDLLRHASSLAQHAPYQPDAFALAACSLIADCQADPRAWWLRQKETLAIDDSSGITLADSMPPRQWLIVEGQAAEIVRLWRAGRHEDLLRGHGAGALRGGG